ncbi:MAG: transcription-repair coupling factor [Bacteroidetes Order II. Incertae sedis bacterium]|nr:transcription-repair coupling factor [Bacteroidetes Order II. bacterium]
MKNLSLLLDKIDSNSQVEKLKSHLLGVSGAFEAQPLLLKGVSGSLDAFLVASVLRKESLVVCILPSYEMASYLYSDLSQILGSKNEAHLLLFGATDQHPYDVEQVADNQRMVQRSEVLQRLSKGFKGVLVASADALAEMVPLPEVFEKASMSLAIGDMLGPELLVELLIEQGFELVTYVQHPGEIARRGGIVDVFSYVGNYPVRFEFFGDELDTIREFDPSNQRSVSRLTQVTIVPNLRQVQKGARTSLLKHLHRDAVVFIRDLLHVEEVANKLFGRAAEVFKRKGGEEGNLLLPEELYLDGNHLVEEITPFRQVHYGSYIGLGHKPCVEIAFRTQPPPDFNGKIHFVRKKIVANHEKGWQTLLLCDSRGQEIRLRELLDPYSSQERNHARSWHIEEEEEQEATEKKGLRFMLASLAEGFEWNEIGVALYTDHQIFNRYHRPTVRKQKQRYGGFSLRELINLTPGDFVTHIDYGIGKYEGLQKIEVRGKQQEVVRLVFRDSDVLYVNINALYKLHRYTGKEGHQPKLSKLGTGEWERTRNSTKKKVKDIARDLIKLYAERKKAKGFGFTPDSVWSRELEASFEFEDTPDQAKTWDEVRADMEKGIPMDRLVCGDVGFGKTEIAVRAAFKAVQDGKQVAVLVPTTILAAQHHKTFTERLAQFPVTVEVMSRFQTEVQIKETLKRLKERKVDIVIGTHRIAAKRMDIPALGLLVIDEEQRFGVAVKERLRQMRANVDTLTLTATPIPRTLQFSLMGARDLSYINTPPPNRQPIQTEIHSFDKNLIRDAILYETGRGGQVFFIHNRVQSIEEMATTLRQLVPGVRIKTAHGQMDSERLEKEMMDFMQRKYEVLVSTNIVESGLDISNANTIIINHAERFGLAELHQLRGRVGRSNRKAFCYLLVQNIKSMTKEAKQRLQAIEQFSELGSGLNVAMRDLDIRGAGDLLGGEQSGFIADVGYETYQRILEEAILELKAEEFGDLFEQSNLPPKPLTETLIDLDVDAYIPDYYVEDRVERLNLYRALSECKDAKRLSEIREEWQDRFGPIPIEAQNLLSVMELKVQVEPLRLPKVQFKNQRLFLTMPPNEDVYFYQNIFKNILEKVAKTGNRYVLKDTEGKLRIIIQQIPDMEEAVRVVRKIL